MLIIKKTIKKLLKKNITISVVESCTGGLLSSKITAESGVSKIFKLGLITYSNNSKVKILKVPKNIIKKYGAVSSETAEKMVFKLKKISNSKLCISVTGIAGPLGGSKQKPVGLVYIGFIYNKKFLIIKKKYKGSRKIIQNSVVKTIFNKIYSLV